MQQGIRPSISGTDGPGVYAWIGSLKTCIENAELMMFDGLDMDEEQVESKMRQFTVLACHIPFELNSDALEGGLIIEWWADYVVLRDAILPDEITVLGNFLDFRKRSKSVENTHEEQVKSSGNIVGLRRMKLE